MGLWKSYLMANRDKLLLTATFFFVYFVSFTLFRIPMGVILYSSLLCMIIGGIYVLWDIYRFGRRHRQLERMRIQRSFDVELFPEPSCLWEEDYQELVTVLLSERNHLELEQNSRYGDMIEYYTIWVHQIKTPIASMRLLLQGQDSDFSRNLRMELLQVEQYVEMVLCYLRLDSDTTDYVIKRVDLDTVVRQEVKRLAPQFIQKKLMLEYEPLDCVVLTDEKWLGFVLGQVLSNAVKYTREGKVTITLKRPQVLMIRDTGMGIAGEDLPRIFEKGFTGFNGRTDKKASGIGLYLCKRICDNLGHKITVGSTVDEGTYVCIDMESRDIGIE